MDVPIVRDQQDQVQSWDWLLASLGPLHVERAAPTALGQPVFRLEQVRVVEGPAVLIVRVSDAQGLPIEGILAVRSWAGAPDLPAWTAPAGRWRDQGVCGPTGRIGTVAFGLGASDTYQLPDAGPASVWVADRTGPSDRIDGLGVLNSTKRLHLDLSFRMVQELAPILSDAGADPSIAQAASATVEPPPLPPSPPAVPLPLAGNQWALLIERLDLVIHALEDRIAD